jgi:hypothetical protein
MNITDVPKEGVVLDEDQTIPVSMRLRPHTMSRINDLTKLTGITNRTDLISRALILYEPFAKYNKEGKKIMLEDKDGSKETLRIMGIFNAK